MIKIKENNQTVPKRGPKIVYLEHSEIKYSIPKIFIPKDQDGKPTVKRQWYVWFNYKNPHKGIYDGSSKFIVKHGINRHKTVAGRKVFGKSLVKAYTKLLLEGFNPYTNEYKGAHIGGRQDMTFSEAIKLALAQKSLEIAASTKKDWEYRVKKFLEYATSAGFADFHINDVTTFHISSFLNALADEGQSAKSINNFKACLSGLYSKLANDGIADGNPVLILKKRKENPQKNKPFTPKEINEIKKYLLANDPGLLSFIRFVGFAFLRPVEVVRLKVGDIDVEGRSLTVQTKTEARATVRIVPQLVDDLKEMKLSEYSKTDFLFTPEGSPGSWINTRTGKPTAENTRTKEFSDRFADVKKHFGFGSDHGIYSFRHSFAIDLYNAFINGGATSVEAELKMLPITRHKSLSGLRNYLRDVGALMPKDYGKNFTLDF